MLLQALARCSALVFSGVLLVSFAFFCFSLLEVRLLFWGCCAFLLEGGEGWKEGSVRLDCMYYTCRVADLLNGLDSARVFFFGGQRGVDGLIVFMHDKFYRIECI